MSQNIFEYNPAYSLPMAMNISSREDKCIDMNYFVQYLKKNVSLKECEYDGNKDIIAAIERSLEDNKRLNSKYISQYLENNSQNYDSKELGQIMKLLNTKEDDNNKRDRFVVLDTETTGFNAGISDNEEEGQDRLLEVAALLYENGECVKVLHKYVDPQRDVPQEAVKVHGITREVAIEKGNGQTFSDVWKELVDFCKNEDVVIHNAEFDLKFLDFELQHQGRKTFVEETKCRVIDTLLIARKKFSAPGQRNSLDALAKRFHIENKRFDGDPNGQGIHGAAVDCELLADVYKKLVIDPKKLAEQNMNREGFVGNKIDIERIPEKGKQLRVQYASKLEIKEHENMTNSF